MFPRVLGSRARAVPPFSKRPRTVNSICGVGPNRLPHHVRLARSGGRGFPGRLQFSSVISFQAFQVFARFRELRRTTIEKSATLNGKRLVVNIADDMCLRFQNNLSFRCRVASLGVGDGPLPSSLHLEREALARPPSGASSISDQSTKCFA